MCFNVHAVELQSTAVDLNRDNHDALERLPDEVSETEAAAMLGVGPRTIYSWTQRFAAGDDGFCDERFRFPHRTVRERRYYRKAELERVVGLRADYMTLAQAEVALGLTYRMLDRRVRANLSVPASVRIYGAAMYHVDTLAAWARTLRLDTHEALTQARRVARLHAVVWPTEHAASLASDDGQGLDS